MTRLAKLVIADISKRRDPGGREPVLPARDPRAETPESGVYAVVGQKPDARASASEDAKNALALLHGDVRGLRDAVARGATRAELESAIGDMEASLRRLDDVVRQAATPKPQEPGGLTPRLAPVNVSSVLQAVYQQVHRQAASAEIAVEVRILADAETKMDRGLVERALLNLVDNALRFAPPTSKVRIGCDVVDESVELTVSDEGPGIDKAHCDRIFEPYFTTTAGSFPGEPMDAGVGLAFCRAVARAHGGDVRATPRGTGGCFVVELPLRR